MADINLKTETPDTSLPTDGFLFGADSQAASAPSVFTTQSVATTLLGSTSLTGATVTTSQPVLDLAQTWNASGVTFTGLKFNVASDTSAAASLLMDLQVGGVSQFRVSKTGTTSTPSGLNLGSSTGTASTGQVFFYNTSSTATALAMQNTNGTFRVSDAGSFQFHSASNVLSGSTDLFLTRRAAANLRLGAADVGATTSTVTITIAAPGVVTWTGHGLSTGTPVVFTTTGALPTGITAGTTYYAVVVDANTFQIASSVANAIAATPTVITTSGTQSGTHTGTRYNITQRLSMQSITGVTDRLGADLFIQGSQGTGTGAGGSIIFQVAPAGSTGTAQNALATALTIGADRTATFVAVNTPVLRPTPGNDLLFNGASVGAAWRITPAGHFFAYTDNTYDIGASGATRPRNVYVAGSVFSGGSIEPSGSVTLRGSVESARRINVNGYVSMRFPSDGVFTLLNDAGTDFGRLQFGGTTSSFPALKRVSANLQIIAADGTSSAGLIVGNQALATAATDGFLYVPTCAGTPTGTPTTQTGTVPIIVDTTNNKLYFYSGAAWRDAGP